MRKYNKKILKALVIAYKKGLINKKPLEKWTSRKEISYNLTKYLIYIISFIFIFFVFNKTVEINDVMNIFGYAISKSRLISGISVGFLSIVCYKLFKYLYYVYTVYKAIKNFNFNDGNVEILNKVTFKIDVN